MKTSFKVVIPARYASTRLAGKPLADIAGKAMIVRVVERAMASGASEVVVATDDERVLEAVLSAGYQAQLTRADHASGSDRVMEVVAQRAWTDDTLVINVQGDEPLIPPLVIGQLAQAMADRPEVPVGTLCERIQDRRLLFDPNVVKVVRGQDDRALYFSRAPIPFARDAFARDAFARDASGNSGLIISAADASQDAAVTELPADGCWYRHIGVYGFRVHALRRFVGLPLGALERLEALEQLRLLEHGIPLLVTEARVAVPGGVDTPGDLARVRALLGADDAGA